MTRVVDLDYIVSYLPQVLSYVRDKLIRTLLSNNDRWAYIGKASEEGLFILAEECILSPNSEETHTPIHLTGSF